MSANTSNLPASVSYARMIMIGGFATTSVMNYAFSLTMGWLLIPSAFGLLAFAQTLLLIGGLLLNSGFSWSLTASLVRAPSADRGGLIRGALLANTLFAGCIAAIIGALFALGPLRSGLETATVTLMVCASLPGIAVVIISRATAQGFEQFTIVALIQIAEVFTKAIGGTALVLLGYGVTGAIGGFALGAWTTALIGLFFVFGRMGVSPWGSIRWPTWRVASSMFGAVLGMSLLLNFDMLMLKLYTPTDQHIVGQYQAAIVLANTPYFLSTALLTAVFPQLARIKQIIASAPVVGSALRLILVFLVPVELAFILAPAPILGLLFPVEYQQGAMILPLLAAGNCALMCVGVFTSVWQATERAHIPAAVLLGVTLCESVALRLAIPLWQGIGAASVFSGAAYIAGLILGGMYIWHLTPAQRWEGLHWCSRYCVIVVACFTLATMLLWYHTPLILTALIIGALYLTAIVAGRLIQMPTRLSARFSAQQHL